MNAKNKHRLVLTAAIHDVLDYIENCKSVESSTCDSLIQALSSLGVLPDNHMIALLQGMKVEPSGWQEFRVLCDKWLDLQVIAMANGIKKSTSHKTQRLGCDRKFNALISEIKTQKATTLIEQAMDHLKKIQKETPSLYELLTVGYRGWYFEKNWLDGIGGQNNSLVENRINTLKNNTDKIEWLYDHLEDNLSRASLNALIKSWLTFSMQEALNVSVYSTINGVMNPDIFPVYDQEVFVDCGAYIGDTVAEFVNEFNQDYKTIHTYDISEPTVSLMKENLKNLRNIVFNVKGVADKQGELSLAGVDAPFHGNRLVMQSGSSRVPIVKLDDDIKEPITFLKIDVEGLDKEALNGARNHIIKYHPKIHVDTYHKLVDFFEVPLLIHGIDPSYRFYLRTTNSIEKPLMFVTTCVYAI